MTRNSDFTWMMQDVLRRTLHRAVNDEGWDDEYKSKMHAKIDAIADDDEIPYPSDVDPEDLENVAPVASMIEYFGIGHVAEHGELPPPVEEPTESWLWRNPG